MEFLILNLLVIITFIILAFVFLGEFRSSKRRSKEIKKIGVTHMFRTISDMEHDGVYFSDSVIEEIKKQKEELTCHYSGLGSMKSWE